VPAVPAGNDTHGESDAAVHAQVAAVVTLIEPLDPAAGGVTASGDTLNVQACVGGGVGVGVGVGLGVGVGVGVGVGAGVGLGVGLGVGVGVGLGVGVGVGAAAAACSTYTAWSATSALPVRAAPVFGSTVSRIVEEPLCDVDETCIQLSLAVAVQVQADDAVSMRTDRLPPPTPIVPDVGLTVKWQVAASCAMTTCASFTDSVARRVEGSTFAVTR